MIRLALLTVLLSSAALAQSSSPVPIDVSDYDALEAYAGLYATDGGMIEVRSGDGLEVVAHGAPVAARLVALATPDPATDDRAQSLLDAWVAADLEAVVTAVRADGQASALESFGVYRSALERGHGPAVASSVIGTFDASHGGRVTLVQILFERGSEWASLVWDQDGALVTMTRGLSPVVVGTIQPAERDAFAADGLEVRFERNTDGRIDTLRVDDRFVAIR